MSSPFHPGQRWSSAPEPELGLGLILKVTPRDVEIRFESAELTRRYRSASAPLKRALFKKGDVIRDREGNQYTVEGLAEKNKVVHYLADGQEVPETKLADRMAFNDLADKLMVGESGHIKDFLLRVETQRQRHSLYSKKSRGLLGARVELLEHQIFIAENVLSSPPVRVLLADEVGLGKTIEAGLIFHGLSTRDLIRRTLVITPKALVYQWLVELYRKFNEMFTVVNPDDIDAEDKKGGIGHILHASQNIIVPQETLIDNPSVTVALSKLQWDLLIVDEAHHLNWRVKQPSPAYQVVALLATKSTHLLLLTATPLQLGEESHFGRLRLLDPVRFADYEQYLSDMANYRELIPILNSILSGNKDPVLLERLKAHYADDAGLLRTVDAYLAGEDSNPAVLVEKWIDRHGTGRMVYRNRRSVLKGFPRRLLFSIPLEWDGAGLALLKKLHGDLKEEPQPPEAQKLEQDPLSWTPDRFKKFSTESGKRLKSLRQKDPRLLWLRDFLHHLPEEDKVLLICDSKEKILILQELLPRTINISTTVFHEDLSLVIRDKNAAFFARPDGARLLLSSEIGSEGRNFQFAKHLVLFDLPASPGVLEQRIGRLHRIGQKSDVNIHCPIVKGTPHEIFFRWFHEGLNAFEAPHLCHDHVCAAMWPRIEALARTGGDIPPDDWEKQFDKLIADTQKQFTAAMETVENGRDRMLELHSFQAGRAADRIREIISVEEATDLETYLEKVFDVFGIDFTATVEKRAYQIFPGPEMILDAFPNLPDSGLFVTFSREQALVREDLAFMSWEHPIVTGAMDLILGTSGNATAIARWERPEKEVFLKCGFVLEAILSPVPGMPVFLPPTPVEILIDHSSKAHPELMKDVNASYLTTGSLTDLAERGVSSKQLKTLMKGAESQARSQGETLKASALEKLNTFCRERAQRLEDLSAVNHLPIEEEKSALRREYAKITRAIESAEVRLDAMCLILAGPEK